MAHSGRDIGGTKRALWRAMSKPLEGKVGVVFGVANKRSIAWGIAQAWAQAGAKLIFNYQGESIVTGKQIGRAHV